MACGVVFPGGDTLPQKREREAACGNLAVHLDGEIAHASGLEGEVFQACKAIGPSVQRNVHHRCACLHRLRHHNGSPLIACVQGCGGSLLRLASGCDNAGGKVDGGFAHQVGQLERFLHTCPFFGVEAFAHHQCHPGTSHAVVHGHVYAAGGGSHIGRLAPQEVTGFVAAHACYACLLALVGLHVEGVQVDALRMAHGVVGVDIHVRVLVFPVDGRGGCPLSCGSVEGVLHVVGTVAVDAQRTWLVALIIDHIYAHAVAVGKSFVIDACYSQLLYLGPQRERSAGTALLALGQCVGST